MKIKIGVEEYNAEVIVRLTRKDGTRVDRVTAMSPGFALSPMFALKDSKRTP